MGWAARAHVAKGNPQKLGPRGQVISASHCKERLKAGQPFGVATFSDRKYAVDYETGQIRRVSIVDKPQVQQEIQMANIPQRRGRSKPAPVPLPTPTPAPEPTPAAPEPEPVQEPVPEPVTEPEPAPEPVPDQTPAPYEPYAPTSNDSSDPDD